MFVTGAITEKRSNKIYSELENRYNNIKESNSELWKVNIRLAANNKQLGEELADSEEFVKRTRDITSRLQDEIRDTTDTIARIELTIGAIEQIIIELPE